MIPAQKRPETHFPILDGHDATIRVSLVAPRDVQVFVVVARLVVEVVQPGVYASSEVGRFGEDVTAGVFHATSLQNKPQLYVVGHVYP